MDDDDALMLAKLSRPDEFTDADFEKMKHNDGYLVDARVLSAVLRVETEAQVREIISLFFPDCEIQFVKEQC